MYKYRYVILALDVAMNMLNMVNWLSLQPVALTVKVAFDQSTTNVNLLTLMYSIVALIMIIPSSFVFHQFGIKVGMYMSATFLLVGMWVKTASRYNFWFLIIGQIIGAFANPLL